MARSEKQSANRMNQSSDLSADGTMPTSYKSAATRKANNQNLS